MLIDTPLLKSCLPCNSAVIRICLKRATTSLLLIARVLFGVITVALGGCVTSTGNHGATLGELRRYSERDLREIKGDEFTKVDALLSTIRSPYAKPAFLCELSDSFGRRFWLIVDTIHDAETSAKLIMTVWINESGSSNVVAIDRSDRTWAFSAGDNVEVCDFKVRKGVPGVGDVLVVSVRKENYLEAPGIVHEFYGFGAKDDTLFPSLLLVRLDLDGDVMRNNYDRTWPQLAIGPREADYPTENSEVLLREHRYAELLGHLTWLMGVHTSEPTFPR